MRAACETCGYWLRSSEHPAGGECHRFPPTLLVRRFDDRYPERDFIETHWPWMEAKEWCGEHQPAETERIANG